MNLTTTIDKCNVCKCWAIFELKELEGSILKICTRCENKYQYMKSERYNLETMLKESKSKLDQYQNVHPELKYLKTPGDFAKLPDFELD